MGAISDTGWEYFQAQAWRSLEKTYPGKVKVTVLENITQIQDCERLFRQMSTQGNKLIFGTTFSQYASLKKLAPTHAGLALRMLRRHRGWSTILAYSKPGSMKAPISPASPPAA